MSTRNAAPRVDIVRLSQLAGQVGLVDFAMIYSPSFAMMRAFAA